jgi:hypothetical protein
MDSDSFVATSPADSGSSPSAARPAHGTVVITPVSKDPKRKNGSVKKAKKNKVTYTMFTYTFKNGAAPTHVEGVAAAAAFVRSYGGLIESTRKFSVRTRWIAYKAKLDEIASVPVPVVAPDSTSATAADEASVSRIMERLSATRPVDCFQGWYMTTPDATKMVVVVRLLSVFTGDHWCWRPDAMCDILSNYMEELKPTCSTLKEAFQNLTTAASSDINTRERYPLFKKWKGRDGTEQETPSLTAYTIVTIPVDTLCSTDEEDKWMEQETGGILDWFKRIMETPVFKMTMFKTKEGYAKSLYNESLKTNLPKFLKNAIQRVNIMGELTDYVIPSAAQTIMSVLMSTRQSTMKYEINPVVDVDADDLPVAAGDDDSADEDASDSD